MAEAAIIDEQAAPATAKQPRFSRKTLIIIGICLALASGGGVAAWFFLGKDETPAAAAQDATPEVFVDVPAMIVNLRSADGAPRLIKLRLMLVPAKADGAPAITTRLPIIIDSFQPFLRELRPEDLAGSAAVFRIKEELLVRANDAAGAGTVKDVLIQDLIQQ